MKPWMWIVIVVVFAAIVLFAIVATKRANETQMIQHVGTPTGKQNVWDVIAGVTGILGQAAEAKKDQTQSGLE